MNEKEQLVSFIKEQLGQGTNIDTIKNLVKVQGWTDTDIDMAVAQANTEIAINIQSQNAPTPAFTGQPASSLVNPNPVIMNEQPSRSIFKKVILTVGILILVGAISVGAYFGYTYFKSSKVTLGAAVINTLEAFSKGQITSGEYSMVTEITAKDVSKNYSDISADAKEITSQLQDVSASFAYSGIVNKTTDNNIETSGDLSISIKNPNGGSLGMFGSQEMAVKYKTFSDNVYVNVEKIPSIASMFIPTTIDITKYLNQWFSMPSSMAKQTSGSFTESLTNGGPEISTTTITAANVKKQIISLFDESGAFTVIDQKTEKTEKGTVVNAMYIKIDWDKLGEEIIKISQQAAEENGTTFTKSSELEIKTNIEKMKEIPITNSVIKVLVGDDGYLHGYVSTGDLMDKDNSKIGNYKISVVVDNLNKSFVIEKPANARDFTEVMMEINTLMNGGKVTNPTSGVVVPGKVTGATGLGTTPVYSPVTRGIFMSSPKPMIVSKTANMFVKSGSVLLDGKTVNTDAFKAGNAYTISLSGVTGFTEILQKGDPMKSLVDITGKFTVYDSNNKIVKNTDNLFSAYPNGVNAADAQYLQAKLTLPAGFSSGSYRWEFIVTDNKNSQNSIKAVVNFKI